ncbi:MAG TPA: M50 family metallopeptidase [Solirubrobacteraceae bacterium]|nr:M50 family metallopeptidase [Solirubrobacteraceae bacterium]
MSYLLAFAGFAALIVLHEFGHFAAAKAVGMRVERFSLFFPPLLLRRKRGETEYAIGAIPLGGYVKISGMSPHEELSPEVAPRAYLNQPVWKRIVVIAAGPAMNVVIAFVILFAIFLANGIPQSVPTKLFSVDRGSAAAGVLKPGDRVVAVDGRDGGEPALARAIAAHRCAGRLTPGCRAATPASVTVLRDGRRLTVAITPRYDAAHKKMRLGVTFGGVDYRPAGPLRAAGHSGDRMWAVTTTTVSAIGKLFYSSQARKQVSGVVGSYEFTQQSFAFDTTQALNVLAIISLSLAIVNLFPFLPLDGGHIFWALAEKIRRRPIPYTVIERASAVGFFLVIFIFAVGLSNDIGRLRGAGFGVR